MNIGIFASQLPSENCHMKIRNLRNLLYYLGLRKLLWVGIATCLSALHLFDWFIIFTSPAAAVAKYRDEHVCVCLSVCLSARISPETHARSFPIFLCMLPMAMARSFSRSHAAWRNPKGRSHFGGCLGHSITLTISAAAIVAAFAAKGIIQSPITSCSRRDQLVCQTSANRNPENSERRDAAYQPGGGWWECAAWAKSDICDCLVLYLYSVLWWINFHKCNDARTSSTYSI